MPQLPHAKKSLGQHWLTDPVSLQSMCDAAVITPMDVVLEVGPGIGTLTQLLTAQAGRVVAVEYDGVLAQKLPARVSAPNLEVVHQDILRFDLDTLSPGYKIVANIPYYLTSNLIRVLSETSNPPSIAALLVQKEVAERVAAKPGEMSILAVTAQFYWEVSLGRVVPAVLFTPAPKVDSQILVLKRRQQPLFPDVDAKIFFHIVKAGFSQRRKTLLNSLSAGLRLARQQTGMLLQSAHLSIDQRAQELPLDAWRSLYERYIAIDSQEMYDGIHEGHLRR